jgi:DNA-binding NarL/FixJ family response regulator
MAPDIPDTLERARAAFSRRAWEDARSLLATADHEASLFPDDLDRLAIAAHLTGRTSESDAAWTRAHNEHLARQEWELAARSAFRLGFQLLNIGEGVRGQGWIAKAQRVLDEHGCNDCAEQGQLLLPAGVSAVMRGDYALGYATFEKAVAIGRRFHDRDLIVVARHGMGRALIRLGRLQEGLALLDEAMIAVEAGEVSPMFAGDIYCSVIEACFEIFDMRRAQEWTASLTQWCDAQPDLVAYSGQCLVRRAEILQLNGEWTEAVDLARRACERYRKGPEQPAIASAYYQQAELQRLLGDFGAAEELYKEASRRGRSPHPGLALLRLAQGEVEDAAAAIRGALAAAKAQPVRCRLLPAYVDIMLAAEDLDAARGGADELEAIARALDAPLVRASAAQARGAVLLASGDPQSALEVLRQSWNSWQEIEGRYEAAQVRALIGRACRETGDQATAELELDAARWAFEQLSAAPELERLEALRTRGAAKGNGVLTARELEVLQHIAAGHTNRAIGKKLAISEKTVARHVSNIFTKLNLSSRAAATAYAFQQGLTRGTTT